MFLGMAKDRVLGSMKHSMYPFSLVKQTIHPLSTFHFLNTGKE